MHSNSIDPEVFKYKDFSVYCIVCRKNTIHSYINHTRGMYKEYLNDFGKVVQPIIFNLSCDVCMKKDSFVMNEETVKAFVEVSN